MVLVAFDNKNIEDKIYLRFKYSLKTMKDDDLHLCLEMFDTHCQHQLTEPNQSQDNLKTELNMMGLKQYLQEKYKISENYKFNLLLILFV